MTKPSLPRGQVVHLRRPTAADRDRFIELVHASRDLHGSWVHAPRDGQSYAALLRRAHTPTDERVLVCRNEDGAIAGTHHLGQIFRGPFCNAYLGCYAFAPYAGQGYMREGLSLLLAHAFGPLGLHRVEANIQPENTASIALMKGAGFRLEGLSPRYLKVAGEWRDHERWAITVEDLAGGRPTA
ncbi:MAG: GNAT family protein [Actinomycetota bacterium]